MRCPDHPDVNLEKATHRYAYHCPVCKYLVCVNCGTKDGMSWANAFCEVCQYKFEQERKEREQKRHEWEWTEKILRERVISDATRYVSERTPRLLERLAHSLEHLAEYRKNEP